MHNTRKISSMLLICLLAAQPLAYAQQPQSRILVPEEPRAARPELVLQTGVTSPAAMVAFSPDARLMAAMDFSGGVIKLFELATGRELLAINPGERSVFTSALNSALGFSADGASLLVVSGGAVRQWNVHTGKPLRTLILDQGKDFGAVALSQDNRVLATLNETKQSLAVWDAASGRRLQSLGSDPNDGNSIDAVALSPDGRLLATSEETRDQNGDVTQLVLREVASWRVVQSIKVTEEKLNRQFKPGGTIRSLDPARSIRFSPDSRAVAMLVRDGVTEQASGSLGAPDAVLRENTIRIWDVAGGREIRSIVVSPPSKETGMTAAFLAGQSLAFSPDGKQCAAADGDQTIKLFETATGRQTATLGGHGGRIAALAFSADGRRMATTSFDSTIRVWDVAAAATTGRAELARIISSGAAPVMNLAYAGGGGLAVSGTRSVSLWDFQSGASTRTVELPAVQRASLDDLRDGAGRGAFSAGGQFVAARGEGEVKVWETRTGREVRRLPLPGKGNPGGGELSRDGNLIAVPDRVATTAASNRTAPASAPPVMPFPTIPVPDQSGRKKDDKKERKEQEKAQREAMKQMEKMAKSGQIPGMTGDMSQLQKMMEAAQSGDIGRMQEAAGQMLGNLPLVNAGPPMGVRLMDVKEGRELHALPIKSSLGGQAKAATAFSPDGRLLAVSGGGASIGIFDTASGREVSSILAPRALSIERIAFSPDGRALAASVMEMRPGVNMTAISQDTNFAGIYSFTLKLWDVSTPSSSPRELATLAGHSGQVTAVAFSPDGRTVATGSLDATIKLWDVATGRATATLNGHSLMINAIDFSPDGKLLASGGEDGSARLWNAQTGELLATLVSTNAGADWLVVTPDGLFDGTPGAWGQILWRFSPNIFDVAPVESFFNEFFHPGLLGEIASGKRPRAARDVAQKDRRQPVVTLARVDGQTAGRTISVKIEVSEPESSSAASRAGARDLRLFRNGTLVKVWRGDVLKGQTRATLEAQLPIVAGENRLTAYAFNRDNVKSVDAVLNVTGAETMRRKGVAYVIACGVNQYANAQYNLKYAVADATSFAEEVRAQQMKLQQYERVEIIPLLDKEATKSNLLLALKRLSNAPGDLPAGAPQSLAKLQPAQPEDAVMIYFAGHGTAQGARFYLVPHDLGYTGARNALTPFAVQMILARGISDLELEAAIETVDAGQLLFVLDACNSGQALEAEEKRRGPMNSQGLAQLAYEKGMFILTAAQSYQVALEAAQLGHGYLTFALIEEGLKKGMADRDAKDGQVLAREWFNYAAARVPQMQEQNLGSRLLLEEEKAKDPATGRSVQRPRVFYRREAETRPLVVAKP